MSEFKCDGGNFTLDGKPMKIISGSIHYFRSLPEQWRDRLEKLKACGFNTVETYTSWNRHEMTEGVFDFSGGLDIGAFLDTAAELGLYAIVRPGPFICAEWEFGGLPWWLIRYGDVRLRCNNDRFVGFQERYLKELFAILAPRQVTNGGNVLMLQVENEYGSFGDDKEYLRRLRDIYRNNGINVPLFTSDGPEAFWLASGSVEGALATANFGGSVEENMRKFKAFLPEGPHMCTEFWCGWFDHWGDAHHRRDTEEAAATFAQVIDSGCSINVYMFHGGTNFGFMNGANYQQRYEPTTTSYDYDSVLTEAGDLSDKFYAFRRVIEERFGALPPVEVKNSVKHAYGRVEISGSVSLTDAIGVLAPPVHCAVPESPETLGQGYGYTFYRSEFLSVGGVATITLHNVRDRAILYIDGIRRGCVYRRDNGTGSAAVELAPGTHRIEVLLENMGRVNYGVHIFDPKGFDGVTVNDKYIFGWDCFALTGEGLDALDFSCGAPEGAPAFYRGTFTADECADTFLDVSGFGKGFAVINGFNLGRFWPDEGPQRTLYVPAPVIKKGINSIILFESEGKSAGFVTLTDKHDLG